MLAELALAAARRAERTLGPAAAVAFLRPAIETADGHGRRTLLLAGLGAAMRADDRSALASFATAWSKSGGDASEERGVSAAARLLGHGAIDAARTWAQAERDRQQSPDIAFVLAAIAEQSGRPRDAERAWIDAAGTPRGARAALAFAPPERADEVEAELSRSTDPRDVLRLAPAALCSARLYARVRVLDRLSELAQDPKTRAAALRIAIVHVDLRGASLTPIERDRIALIATRAPKNVLDALAGRGSSPVNEAAARDALLGHEPTLETDRASLLALRVLAASARNETSALLLSALATHAPSAVAWTAVISALAIVSSREAALACIDRWLDVGVAPPRGFSMLATELERVGAVDRVDRAWMQAVRACEPGARQSLGAALERRAHAAYAAGDRANARALLERSLAIDPD